MKSKNIYKLLKLAKEYDQSLGLRYSDSLDKILYRMSQENKTMDKIKIKLDGNKYVAEVDFARKDLAKNAGFRWNSYNKRWETSDINIINNLDPEKFDVETEDNREILIPEDQNNLQLEISYSPDTKLYNVGGKATGEYINVLQRLKFKWNPATSRWETPSMEDAMCFASSEALRDRLEKIVVNEHESYNKSNARTSDLVVPVPSGKTMYDFQRAGVEFMNDKDGAILADDMGLGKTIQSVGLMNHDTSLNKILIITTVTAKLNWVNEIKEWSTRDDLSVGYATADNWPSTDIVVASWNLLSVYMDLLLSQEFDLVILDEAHKMKNKDTKMAETLIGKYNPKAGRSFGGIKAKKKIALTGTPIVNRPYELWTILHFIDPNTYNNYNKFAERYMEFKKIRVPFTAKRIPGSIVEEDQEDNQNQTTISVKIPTGPKNLDELNTLLRTSVMMRRTKNEVLKELPPKIRNIIELDINHQMTEEEKNILQSSGVEQIFTKIMSVSKDDHQYQELLHMLEGAVSVAFEKIARARHDLGLEKADAVIQHVTDILESQDGKVVVFAHHHDVIKKITAGIEKEFPGSTVVITGHDSAEKREAIVKNFQENNKIRVFIGSIEATNAAITLTAASVVVFAEMSYVPGTMQQAEDRTHRIGQKSEVVIQYLVAKNSLDIHVAKLVAEKLRIIDQALSFENNNIDTSAAKQVEQIDEAINRLKYGKYSPEQKRATFEALKEIVSKNLVEEKYLKFINSLIEFYKTKQTLSEKQVESAIKIIDKNKDKINPKLISIIFKTN